MSRWNEWFLGAQEHYEFEDGQRIFEFSSDDGRWKPYDKGAQAQLQALLSTCASGPSFATDVNCLGWNYTVKFDLDRENPRDFANAPDEAIGFQFANHEVSRLSKRWIRLTTYWRNQGRRQAFG